MSEFGSYELFFSYVPSDTRSLDVLTNVQGVPMADTSGTATMQNVGIRISSYVASGVTYVKCHTFLGVTEIEVGDFSMEAPTIDHFDIRVYFAKQYLSVYCNGVAVYLYALGEVDYPDIVEGTMVANGDGIVVTNLRCSEIPDNREAVYVDYETTSDSAIQSVIQQRPVQIFPGPGRVLCFTYDAVGDDISPAYIRSYQDALRPNSQVSSDGLVYFADVSISISLATAEQVGLVTKLYRLSELDAGAVQATATFQRLALERRNPISIIMRLDSRIQITDRLIIDLVTSGTGRRIQDSVIVEDMNITINADPPEYTMQVTARRELSE